MSSRRFNFDFGYCYPDFEPKQSVRSVEELAGEIGGKPQTITKRRRKAEALLAAAVA